MFCPNRYYYKLEFRTVCQLDLNIEISFIRLTDAMFRGQTIHCKFKNLIYKIVMSYRQDGSQINVFTLLKHKICYLPLAYSTFLGGRS